MTTKQQIRQIFDSNGIYLMDEDLEKIGAAISETILMLADKIEEEEPQAINTIRDYRNVGHGIEETIEGVDE